MLALWKDRSYGGCKVTYDGALVQGEAEGATMHNTMPCSCFSTRGSLSSSSLTSASSLLSQASRREVLEKHTAHLCLRKGISPREICLRDPVGSEIGSRFGKRAVVFPLSSCVVMADEVPSPTKPGSIKTSFLVACRTLPLYGKSER